MRHQQSRLVQKEVENLGELPLAWIMQLKLVDRWTGISCELRWLQVIIHEAIGFPGACQVETKSINRNFLNLPKNQKII